MTLATQAHNPRMHVSQTMRVLVAIGALIAALAFPANSWAVDEDITPPQLDALSVTPTAVDVTTSSKNVTVTATITDPAAAGGVSSGATGGSITYSPPGGGFGGISGFFSRTSGDQFTATVAFPRFIVAGTWTASVSVSDRVGNFRSYSNQQLTNAGFNTDVAVTSTPDTAPPDITNLTVGPPTAVTVSPPNGQQSVPTTATVTDSLSGVSSVSVSYRSPSGRHSAFGFLQRTTGDQFQGQIVFRPYQEAGTWTISSVNATDVARNTRSLTAAELAALNVPNIEVTSDPEDFDGPELVSLTAEPACTKPNVRGACPDATLQDQVVTIKATITDNLAGVGGLSLSYRSPTGIQSAFVFLQRTTGNQFQGQLTIRQFSQAGHWSPCFEFQGQCNITISDVLGNSTTVNLNDFPDAFISVTRTATCDNVQPGDPSCTTGGSANPINPIQSLLSIPPGGTGGLVEMVITPRTTPTPPNFYLLDQQLDITAPAQPDTSHPMKIEFLVDSSVFTGNPQVQLPPPCIPPVPGAPPPSCSLTVFKNGVAVEKCTAAPPSAIAPDPCIVDPQETVGDDTRITIYTTTASSWNVGIDLTQTDNEPPDCTDVSSTVRTLWPPNHTFRTVSLRGGSDPDEDPLTFTIEGVTQDEPVDAKSGGSTGPDAKLVAVPGRVKLRAERNGNGDGRVYRIAYKLSDGQESCEGIVKVSVAKSQGKTGAARESSASYNSLTP